MSKTKVIRSREIAWNKDEHLTLPEGVQSKVLDRDESTDRVDMIIKFPEGYVEPRHAHNSSHSVVILEGKMIIHGKTLGPGDYVFGPVNEEHGPMEYPEGCTVFASFYGNPSHKY